MMTDRNLEWLQIKLHVCSLGQIDTRHGYHTSQALFPVGLRTRQQDASGISFESSIAACSSGPMYSVGLNAVPGDPDAAIIQVTCPWQSDGSWSWWSSRLLLLSCKCIADVHVAGASQSNC